MSILVLSQIAHYALNDVIEVFIHNPQKGVYEINLIDDPGELSYYRDRLVKMKELKKLKSILSFEETFLKEFKKGYIRDYVYEYLITFNFFRIEDVVYEMPESIEEITFENFFEDIKSLNTFTASFIDKYTEQKEVQTDFVIFNPVVDILPIKEFQKMFNAFT